MTLSSFMGIQAILLSIQLPDNAPGNTSEKVKLVGFLAIHMGELERVMGPWLWPGPFLAVTANLRSELTSGTFALCLSNK